MMPPKSLKELIEADRGDPMGEVAPWDDDPMASGADPVHFQLELKKKRRAAMMRQMLEDSGYGDLAKMVKIKEVSG
jgi:hypothetical protein